jgi:hypothetical protein
MHRRRVARPRRPRRTGLRKIGRCQQLEIRPPNTFRLEASFWPRRRQSSNSNACHGPRFDDITFMSGGHLIGSVRTAPISSREVARRPRSIPVMTRWLSNHTPKRNPSPWPPVTYSSGCQRSIRPLGAANLLHSDALGATGRFNKVMPSEGWYKRTKRAPGQRPLPHHHVSDGLPQRSIHHGMDHLDCRRPVRTRLADRP